MRRGLGPRAVGRFMSAPGGLALRLRPAEGRRRSTAERHPMADGDLMAGSHRMGTDRMAVEDILRWADRTAVAEGTSRWADRMAVAADRMGMAEGTSRWVDRMAAVADRVATVADRTAAAVIVAEIASRARLRRLTINRGGL